MTKSTLEALFDIQVRHSRVPEPVSEYRWHPHRRWRFDYAWPAQQLAVEIEGGVWSKGRHVRGAGFERDCEKYNEAAMHGWRVLRFPGSWVEDGRAIDYLERAINGRSQQTD